MFFLLVLWSILICCELGGFLLNVSLNHHIKRTKDLNYFSLCALNLFNTRVSQFELNYWNKWTFPRHSNLLRYTCVCIYIYIYIYIYIIIIIIIFFFYCTTQKQNLFLFTMFVSVFGSSPSFPGLCFLSTALRYRCVVMMEHSDFLVVVSRFFLCENKGSGKNHDVIVYMFARMCLEEWQKCSDVIAILVCLSALMCACVCKRGSLKWWRSVIWNTGNCSCVLIPGAE